MERLTERYKDGYIGIKGCTSCYKDVERKSAPASNAIVRLAAYEDTGLTPDEITAMEIVVLERKMADIESVNGVPIERVIQLAEADKEGRILDFSAAAIETLLAEREAAGWISVQDRLPPIGAVVLTWGRVVQFGENTYDVEVYNPTVYQPHWAEVTHWMPLPVPPERD